jgi:hypothetical protein
VARRRASTTVRCLAARGFPVAARERIKAAMESHAVVFTTNHDLIVYWSMGVHDTYGGCATVWGGGKGKCAFDLADAEVGATLTPVYFLHGAMHLIVESSGVTRKLVRSTATLLDQFGAPVKGDPRARPLLITEGSSHDKLRAIEDNVYLAHAFKLFRRCQDPLVIFGSLLGEQDQHLVDAVNEQPKRRWRCRCSRATGASSSARRCSSPRGSRPSASTSSTPAPTRSATPTSPSRRASGARRSGEDGRRPPAALASTRAVASATPCAPDWMGRHARRPRRHARRLASARGRQPGRIWPCDGCCRAPPVGTSLSPRVVCRDQRVFEVAPLSCARPST